MTWMVWFYENGFLNFILIFNLEVKNSNINMEATFISLIVASSPATCNGLNCFER